MGCRFNSSRNKNVKCLFFVIDVSTKYTWIKNLKDKKGKTALNAFIENQINYGLIKEENLTMNELMQQWLENNNILALCRMGFFRAGHGFVGEEAKRLLLYLTPKKIQNLFESRDTPLDLCWHQNIFTGNQQILLYQEIQI